LNGSEECSGDLFRKSLAPDHTEFSQNGARSCHDKIARFNIAMDDSAGVESFDGRRKVTEDCKTRWELMAGIGEVFS